MSAAPELDPARSALAAGGHVCLVVDDDAAYADLASDFLSQGSAVGEKPVVLGPLGSGPAGRLSAFAAHTIDPHEELLDHGGLAPERLLARLRADAEAAAADGHRRLRVVADSDWLLRAAPGRDEVVAYEVLLDRLVSDLDATVLCAYRRRSFGPDVVRAVASVHPVAVGCEPPSFTLVAGDAAAWTLSGEVDFESAPLLADALRATAGDPWVVDVSGLLFADVAGMRAIATVATDVGADLELTGAPARLRRLWEVAGFDRSAPGVRFDR